MLRHAKSDWDEPVSDRLRPLAERGLAQAPASGQWLADQGIIPNFVVVSPATRAQQTWELAGPPIVAAADPDEFRVQQEEWAYTFAGSDLMALLDSIPDVVPSVMLVGHNPAFEELAEMLTGGFVRIKTSTVVVIDFPTQEMKPGQGTLREVLRPADQWRP